MTMRKLARRSFLKGSLGGLTVALGLPTLDCFLNGNGTAYAQGAPLPLRFGTWFWGLGWPAIGGANDDFLPTGSGAGAAWSVPAGLSHLAAFKEHLTVFTNYSYTAAGSAAHIPSRGLSLSASHNPEYVLDSGASGFRNQSMPHPSIDALIHESWAATLNTPHSFLNLSLRVGNLYESSSSWNRGGSFRSFYKSPVDLYNMVFAPLAGAPPPEPSGAPSASVVTNRFRKSVLDVVAPELSAFSKSLGKADQLRLQAHLDSVREMEGRVAALAQVDGGVPVASQCSSAPVPQAYASAEQLTLRNKVMADLLVYALSCNLTRLFCFELTPTQCSGTIPEIGLSSGEGVHDAYSHADTPDMRRYCQFVMQNLAYLVGKLKEIPEGSGTLLDQLLMVATSECGPVHYHDYHPYLFIGKAGGRLKGNYHSNRGDRSNNEGGRVLLTAAHAVGVALPKLGMPSTPVTGAGGGVTANYEVTNPISEVLV
ncbi:MAG: DUF1552 domain-containing protein [Myxococcota bacterium]